MTIFYVYGYRLCLKFVAIIHDYSVLRPPPHTRPYVPFLFSPSSPTTSPYALLSSPLLLLLLSLPILLFLLLLLFILLLLLFILLRLLFLSLLLLTFFFSEKEETEE